jgi:hypothetical protein
VNPAGLLGQRGRFCDSRAIGQRGPVEDRGWQPSSAHLDNYGYAVTRREGVWHIRLVAESEFLTRRVLLWDQPGHHDCIHSRCPNTTHRHFHSCRTAPMHWVASVQLCAPSLRCSCVSTQPAWGRSFSTRPCPARPVPGPLTPLPLVADSRLRTDPKSPTQRGGHRPDESPP